MPLCSPTAEEDLLLYGEHLFGNANAPSGYHVPKAGPRAVPSHAWDKAHSVLGINGEFNEEQERDDVCGGGVVYCTLCRRNGRVEIFEVNGEGANATMHRVFVSNSAISGGEIIAWDDHCCPDDE